MLAFAMPRGERDASATIKLFDLEFQARSLTETIDFLLARVDAGRGGVVLTANLDIVRRSVDDPAAARTYARADVVVADGMPIVWASKVAGTPLPERVAGSTMTIALAERAAAVGRSVFLLGGDGDDAALARDALVARFPSLRVVGVSSPRVSIAPTDDEVAPIARELVAASPDFVFVALGSPKQEALAMKLRDALPKAWFLGVGISLAFITGRVERAPELLQRLGLEWVHRLAQEPRRLARRYLVEGLPFAVRLFAEALRIRVTSGRSGPRSSPDVR